MKKFVVLTYGFVPATDEVQRAWGEWFKSVGSPSPLVGYCILNADSLEEAESLVRDMPIIESVRVYEAYSM